MSTSVSTCKCKDHIQAQHRKHTMWLPRKEGICHSSRRENTVNDHRRDIHLRVHVIRSKRMCLPNTLEDHHSESHNWASTPTHKATVIREFSRHHTKKCTTSTRHAQCTHHRSYRDPACSCRQLPCFPFPPDARVIVVFVSQTHFAWFLCSKRFADLFRVRNWGSRLSVKRFLFKRMFKITHVFQLEMWITPKSLLFSGCSLLIHNDLFTYPPSGFPHAATEQSRPGSC